MKIKQAKKNNEKIQVEAMKQVRDEASGSTYGPGMAMQAKAKLPPEILMQEEKKRTSKSQTCPFPGCFAKKKHTTTKSKHCKYNGCKNEGELEKEIATYLRDEYQYTDSYTGEIVTTMLFWFLILVCGLRRSVV